MGKQKRISDGLDGHAQIRTDACDNAPGPGQEVGDVTVHQGYRYGNMSRYDWVGIHLTREDIAKLAKLYPIGCGQDDCTVAGCTGRGAEDVGVGGAGNE
jgi:hypothetical protein